MTLRLSFLLLALLLPPHGATNASAADKPATTKAKGKSKPAKLHVSEKRGALTAPCHVLLSTDAAGAQIVFTTDGTLPAPGSGQVYRAPLEITNTTILRAAAYHDGLLVSELDTHTYLFLNDVLHQTGAGAPRIWGTNQNQPVRADYEMDREIVEHPFYRAEMLPALRALPSLSLVVVPEDLYDPSRGIYANPRQSGDDWERPASVELLPDGFGKGFQENCGLRIQGGWNRRPEESPKHAFRLVFRKKYGAGKLKHRLFDEAGQEEFDTLILRAGCNNTWLHWSGVERQRADYIRDQWMRETYAAMGRPSARGRFVHLYLNGLYWGIYNLTERPDEDFAAHHLGGEPKDYDARNGENVLSGDETAWKRLFALANAGLQSAENYAAVEALLDLPAFADFMLLNLYGANADWDHASNWYAARRREPPGKFMFFVWDGERTLEAVDDNKLSFDDDLSPPRLFQKLRENSKFRSLFAQRARKHLDGNGALTPSAAATRFRHWSELLEPAILAESARWGDYRRDVHPYKEPPYELYTRDRHWRPEVNRLLKDYFPKRTTEVLGQFRAAGLCDPP
jgi:hypothetical protein